MPGHLRTLLNILCGETRFLETPNKGNENLFEKLRGRAEVEVFE